MDAARKAHMCDQWPDAELAVIDIDGPPEFAIVTAIGVAVCLFGAAGDGDGEGDGQIQQLAARVVCGCFASNCPSTQHADRVRYGNSPPECTHSPRYGSYLVRCFRYARVSYVAGI